jgi:hypothetical protein
MHGTGGILRVEFASSVVHFFTLNSLVGTSISINATHIGSKCLSFFYDFIT